MSDLGLFCRQAYATRCAQRAYFVARTQDNLCAAKAEERKLDAMIARVRTGGPVNPDRQATIFDDQVEPE